MKSVPGSKEKQGGLGKGGKRGEKRGGETETPNPCECSSGRLGQKWPSEKAKIFQDGPSGHRRTAGRHGHLLQLATRVVCEVFEDALLPCLGAGGRSPRVGPSQARANGAFVDPGAKKKKTKKMK